MFDFDGAAVRVIVRNGEPWWVASDIARVLDIGRTHDAVRGLDDDEKGAEEIRTLGGTQSVIVISEPGLYALILRSNKPEAKRFRRWVTHEVIPAIRRTAALPAVVLRITARSRTARCVLAVTRRGGPDPGHLGEVAQIPDTSLAHA